MVGDTISATFNGDVSGSTGGVSDAMNFSNFIITNTEASGGDSATISLPGGRLYIAGVAFGMSGCHLTHALGHSLGAVFELHHGMTVGFFIPQSLQYCSPVTDRYLAICDALKVEGEEPEERLANLVAKVRAL